ncbi:Autophagy protein 22 [Microbotryomycetes sp. JL201]|nr:Autophagy protein 22 [Microbotryomycetes sp. JL201]
MGVRASHIRSDEAYIDLAPQSLADNPRIRYRLLVGFAFAGSLATMSFVFLSPQSPLWSSCVLIAVIANVSFGASIVCLNSYLPALGRADAVVVELDAVMHAARDRLRTIRAATGSAPGDVLLAASQAAVRATDDYDTAKAFATSHISARAIAAGYAAGISALILMLVPITVSKGSTWSLRLALAGSGLLWACGTIPAMVYLKPPDDLLRCIDQDGGRRTFTNNVMNGWSGLYSMLRQWRRLPMTFTYLAGWFLLSDAFATVTSTAILFAKTTLAMSTSSLILIAVLTPMSGILGAVFFPRLQRETLHWSNLKMVMLLVTLATLVPLWGIIALRSRWRIYLLSVVFGVVFGAFQAFSRTCFSELVPSSQSARWFGLYSITDKSSSFLGPLLVATITNASGEIRHGFWLIFTMLLLSLPILAQVKMENGRQDAEQFDKVLAFQSDSPTASRRVDLAE